MGSDIEACVRTRFFVFEEERSSWPDWDRG